MARKRRTNEEYWLDRSIQQEQQAEDLTTDYLNKMYLQLERFQRDALNRIDIMYNRYANDHKMSKHDAIQYLTDNQRREFQDTTLAKFRAMVKDPKSNPRLIDALSYRQRISRQEAILAEIELQALELYGGSGGLIETTYKNMGAVYGQSKIAVAKSYGDIGYTFRRPVLDIPTIKSKLKLNWSGNNISQGIWGHEENLYDTINIILEQGFVGKWPQEKIINKIAERVDVARSNIERLVRTEQTAFNSLGAKDQLEAHFEDDYKIHAVLDDRTTARCRSEHGNIYPLSEYQIGKNAPPFHTRCRSSVVSTRDATKIDYFADEHDYTGPELEEIYDEWEKELEDTISKLSLLDFLD